jgi:hypothetical protein
MSLDSLDQVDAIGTEKESGFVVLTIIDSWDWSDEQKHLRAMQAKLNTYFAFIETGEVLASYPNAAGKAIRIEVLFRFAPPTNAATFLRGAAEIASQLGVSITHRVHEA